MNRGLGSGGRSRRGLPCEAFICSGVHIEKINGPFLFADGALAFAIIIYVAIPPDVLKQATAFFGS
jgi:hypothetical protein